MIFSSKAGSGATIWAVGATEALSIVSMGLIVKLSIKTRLSGSRHLRRFSSVWGARSVLVAAVSVWALSQLLVHVANPTPFICELHVALSLGLLQPAFLAALLFLLHSSLSLSDTDVSATSSSPPPHAGRRALLTLFAISSPVFFLQLVVVFLLSGEVAAFLKLRGNMWRSWKEGNEGIICTYPLVSTVIFASFAAGYAAAFTYSAWKALSVVINKSLRLRIRSLACAVLLSLSAQVVFLTIAAMWRPAHDAASLAAFLAALACAIVGEGVLIIKPIADSLAVWGHCGGAWDPWRRDNGRDDGVVVVRSLGV